MKPNLRRTIITLAAAGSIIVGAPALGYAQAGAPLSLSAEQAQYAVQQADGSHANLALVGSRAPFDLRQDDNDNVDNANDNWDDNGNRNDNVDPDDNGNWDDNGNRNDNQDDNENWDNGNANDNVPPPAPETSTVNVDPEFADEADFLRRMGSDASTEMEAGYQASVRGSTEELRLFGDRVMREQQELQSGAALIARAHGVEPLWQPTTEEDVNRIADLATRYGDDFDRVYLRTFIDDQINDINAFNAAKATMTDDVAGFANQHLWTLEEQLRVAREIADRLGISHN